MAKEAPAQKPKKSNIFVRLLAFLLTAALVLGALVLVVYRDRFNLDALKRWLSYRSLETSDTGQAAPFTHAGGDQLSIDYLENGILLSSTAGAHYYSFSGESYAEEIVAMEHPVLSASEKAGVVYDAGDASLFLFRGTQEVFDLSLSGGGDLLSARVNNSGWLAVTAQQSGFKGAVTVYNSQGSEVISIQLSSTFVIDAAISPDCKTVALVTINQENGAFKSQILFYPVDKKEPSAQVDLGNMAVLELDYESQTLWALGEDRLVAISTDDQSVQTYSFANTYLKGYALGGDGYVFLLLGRYRAGAVSQAVTVSSDGSVIASQDLSVQVLDFDSAGNYCSLLTGSGLTIYTKDLQPYSTLSATQGARYTALASDGSAMLADAQQAWLYIPN